MLLEFSHKTQLLTADPSLPLLVQGEDIVKAWHPLGTSKLVLLSPSGRKERPFMVSNYQCISFRGRLMEDFAGSATQLVADVDCTGEGEDLCEEFQIEG